MQITRGFLIHYEQQLLKKTYKVKPRSNPLPLSMTSKHEHIVVPLPFWHNLNDFSFCRTFENLFIICVEILIN
jgi:hypothetical protein